jgi:hypothetical protein
MEKYLRNYAEPEITALDGLPGDEQWAEVLVIPACNESPEFLRPPPPCSGRSLMVLVINESVSALQEVSSCNQALAATVRTRFEPQWQSDPGFPGSGMSLLRDPLVPRDVLLVDRFSEGRKLPAGGGVGHARKIGADLAASMIHHNRIRSPWIHCSDADVQLPDTYFLCGAGKKADPENAALIYPFRHCGDKKGADHKDVLLATQLYELSLRYYVAGMKFAHSPYAFHTIGSTMAVNAGHYAKVRGFPKREAGEDFYLLNKLAKVGSVLGLGESSDCGPIEIAARRSDRVPFGTGAAVNIITALDNPLKAFRYYNPLVFEFLQLWLRSWPAIWQSQSSDLAMNIFPDQPAGLDRCEGLQALLTGLKRIRTDKALDHAFRQSKDLGQFTRQMHTWFDAFRTLKLIHILRDHHLPSVSFAGLTVNPIFCQLLAGDPELMAFDEHFRQQLQE